MKILKTYWKFVINFSIKFNKIVKTKNHLKNPQSKISLFQVFSKQINFQLKIHSFQMS